MRWKLPPPRAMIALESVVRTGSVSSAAAELCVTQSAVSKQIGQLEEWFGQPLFGANRRHMEPTLAAKRLADAAGIAWGLLAAAVDEVAREGCSTSLRVVAPASFAMRWLLPRLPLFQAANAGIKISVRQTHTTEKWEELPFDAVIRRGEPASQGLSVTTFLHERLSLVAKPGSCWAHATRLSDLTFIEADTRPGELLSWIQSAEPELTSGSLQRAFEAKRFAHFYIALEAALAGQGAIVAPNVIVSELLRDGSLTMLFADHQMPGAAYWVGTQPLDSRPHLANFVSWIIRSGEEWPDQVDRRDLTAGALSTAA